MAQALMPKISVIIAAYNAERYIEQTISSILSQTEKDLDVWVVDDGSTDRTEAIVSAIDGPIHYIKQENAGPAAARNNGIKSSSGAYIAILDADDLWSPDKLEKQLARMTSERTDFSCTAVKTVDSEGQTITEKSESISFSSPDLKAFLRQNFIATSSVLIKREALDEVGLFDESAEMRGVEDGDLWFRLFMANKKLTYLDTPLLAYRIHAGNLSGQFSVHQRKRDYAHSKMVMALQERGHMAEVGGANALSKSLAGQFSYGAASLALRSESGIGISLKRVSYAVLNSTIGMGFLRILRSIKHLSSARS